jgi:UDP-glucose 4-epimerase
MKTVLILGGYGFLGSNIIGYASDFLKEEYKFIVFDFFNNHPLNIRFDNIIKSYKGDFTNQADLKAVFEEHTIDYVFHFISTTVPATSNSNIIYDIESNLVSTVNILELSKNYGVKQVVYISSGGAIYGASENYIHKEDDPLVPISSYGIVKLTVEKYLQLCHHLFGLNYLVLRLSNPYGPFHLSKKQGLINVALERAMSNEAFEVWGDGSNTKDYIYSEDVAMILYKLLDKEVTNKILNVGSSSGYSVNDILRRIQLLVPHFVVNYQGERSFDVPKVILDTKELRGYIDFELVGIEAGINKTYEWLQQTNQLSR